MTSRQQIVWGALAASLVLALGSLTAEGGVRKYRRLASDVQTLERETARLKAENQQLRRQVRRLKDDPQALEQAAREELGFIGEAELVFNFEEP